MRAACLTVCSALLMVTTVLAENPPRTLFDFTGADAAKEWQSVNDGVMGGVSEGKFKITETKTMEFFGTLSLENNGGFASVRTKAKKLGLEKGDTVVAKVRGDGREYTLNLYVNKPLIPMSPLLPIQVIHKTLWQLVFVLPRLPAGRSREVPWGISLRLPVIVLSYPWVIPWGRLFGS